MKNQTKNAAAASDPPAEARAEPNKRFSIKTPNGGFRGERAGVKFHEGVGYTDDAKVAAALADLGYEVTEA